MLISSLFAVQLCTKSRLHDLLILPDLKSFKISPHTVIETVSKSVQTFILKYSEMSSTVLS